MTTFRRPAKLLEAGATIDLEEPPTATPGTDTAEVPALPRRGRPTKSDARAAYLAQTGAQGKFMDDVARYLDQLRDYVDGKIADAGVEFVDSKGSPDPLTRLTAELQSAGKTVAGVAAHVSKATQSKATTQRHPSLAKTQRLNPSEIVGARQRSEPLAGQTARQPVTGQAGE